MNNACPYRYETFKKHTCNLSCDYGIGILEVS